MFKFSKDGGQPLVFWPAWKAFGRTFQRGSENCTGLRLVKFTLQAAGASYFVMWRTPLGVKYDDCMCLAQCGLSSGSCVSSEHDAFWLR